MGTGQTLLTLGAITLFLLTSLSVNRSILQTTKTVVNQQEKINAINYGQSIAELLHSHPGDLESFQITYGSLNDATDPDSRLNYITETGEELVATIDIKPLTEMLYNVPGVIATITVYELKGTINVERAIYSVALPIE